MTTLLAGDRAAQSNGSLEPLARDIAALLADRPAYAVYVEDLTSGEHLGIREDDAFEARSLAKVYALVAILRDVEAGEYSLDDTITITDADRDSGSGSLAGAPPGSSYTIQSLLDVMIRESDNTATNILEHRLSPDDYAEAVLLFNLTVPHYPEPLLVTPRSYGQALATLYRGEYLDEQFTAYALELLATTRFSSQIPAGVPAGVLVAHKVGAGAAEGSHHDCGIVFAQQPYVLCVMSANTTMRDADETLSEISRMAYEWFASRSAYKPLQ